MAHPTNRKWISSPQLPSGKRLHNYGKSPFSMGKSTINGSFSIALLNYQMVHVHHWGYGRHGPQGGAQT